MLPSVIFYENTGVFIKLCKYVGIFLKEYTAELCGECKFLHIVLPHVVYQRIFQILLGFKDISFWKVYAKYDKRIRR